MPPCTDRPDAVVFVYQLLDIHTSKNKLLPVNRNKARNCRRFVRHFRSLHTSTTSAQQFLHTFQTGRFLILYSIWLVWLVS